MNIIVEMLTLGLIDLLWTSLLLILTRDRVVLQIPYFKVRYYWFLDKML